MNKAKFQKVIKAIRDDQPKVPHWSNKEKMITPEYPKAMMTSQQMAKGTATVNCGGSEKRVNAVINDPRFLEILETSNAKASIETNSEGSIQIRIKY